MTDVINPQIDRSTLGGKLSKHVRTCEMYCNYLPSINASANTLTVNRDLLKNVLKFGIRASGGIDSRS